MKRTYSDGPVAGTRPDDSTVRNLEAKLCNSYVRLAAPDRQKVVRIIKQFAFGKACSTSYWDWWSNYNLKSCYRQLKPISQEMANDLLSFASELLKLEENYCLALEALAEQAQARMKK